MKYYLYLHYRQDKGEIFYVGIGTKSKTDLKYNYYKRAYSNKNRSKFWNNIIKLNPDYQIIILLESDNYDYIVYKEKELIDFYGRKDLNTGSLCNLTNGGEGTNGLKFNEELKLKWSKLAKLRAKYGKENHSSKPLYQYSLKGDFIKQWDSKADCGRTLNMNPSTINSCCKGRNKTAFGFQWFDIYKGLKIKEITKGKCKKDGYLDFKDPRILNKYGNIKSCK